MIFNTPRASFAVSLMQKRGVSDLPRGRVSLQSRQVGGGLPLHPLLCKHVECIKVLLHHYLRRFTILFHILATNPDQNGFLVKNLAKIQFFLYFCTGNQISWFLWGRMSLWRHRSETLGMLVLILVSMFKRDSKLTIGTKMSIIRGFILKIWGMW